ncbi:hypothetical protein [Qipengyuania nanhaisediminis]|uniref:hypothetical protein n=1 Tax=Qipengyuania nanhaisediminis TaxID=604088 RepID=UPI0038B317E5
METNDIAAWIFLIMGIYSIAAGIVEWRVPGTWVRMVDDIAGSPALLFLTGIVCLGLGGAIYLVGGWDSDDWMVIAVKVIGGWMIVEGALFLAIGDKFLALSRAMMGAAPKLWAIIAGLIGIGAIIVAIPRF